MQHMSARAFNPLKAARAFKEAGADEKLAEAMAGAIGDATDAVEIKLATKADLNAFEQRTISASDALEQRTTSAMEALEQRMMSALEALEQRTTSAMEALEQRMKTALYRTLWLQTGVIIAAVTAVTKLLP